MFRSPASVPPALSRAAGPRVVPSASATQMPTPNATAVSPAMARRLQKVSFLGRTAKLRTAIGGRLARWRKGGGASQAE